MATPHQRWRQGSPPLTFPRGWRSGLTMSPAVWISCTKTREFSWSWDFNVASSVGFATMRPARKVCRPVWSYSILPFSNPGLPDREAVFHRRRGFPRSDVGRTRTYPGKDYDMSGTVGGGGFATPYQNPQFAPQGLFGHLLGSIAAPA